MMANRKHIAVIDPAAHTAELESFNRLTAKHEHIFSYHLPQLMGLDSLENIGTKIDIIIILGQFLFGT